MLYKILMIFSFFYSSVLFSQTKPSSVIFGEGNSSSKLKVSIFDNIIYIPISINKSAPVDFILDTGAPELSIIGSEISSKLKLDTKRGGDLSGAGNKNVKFKLIENVKLSLGSIVIINPKIGTISLVHMEPYWGKPKHGILGGNVLKELVTEINYTEKSVIFHKPENFSYRGMGKIIPVEITDNSIIVRAKIQQEGEGNPIEGKFLIDTAVRNTFLNSPFTKKYKLIEKSKKIIENITGFGIGGVGFGKLSRLHSLELGGYSIKEPIVELTTDTKGIASSKQFDGIIGADILSRFTVILDYVRKEIILYPNKNFHHSFEYDKSGIYFILDDNDTNLYKVAHVIKGSPASKVGILKDDIILEVDHIPSQKFNYEEMKNYFKREKSIKLKILRDKLIKEFDINLEKLL